MQHTLAMKLLDHTNLALAEGNQTGALLHGDDHESSRLSLETCASICGLVAGEGENHLKTKTWTGILSGCNIDDFILGKFRQVYPDVVTLTTAGHDEHPYFGHDNDGLFLRRRGTFPRNPDSPPQPTMPQRPIAHSASVPPEGTYVDRSDWSAPPMDPREPNW